MKIVIENEKYPLSAVPGARAYGRVITQGFSHRRKTLRNALRALVSPEALRDLGIDPESRAAQPGPEEFANLARPACKKGSPA